MKKRVFFRILFLSLLVSFSATSCLDKNEIPIPEGTLNTGDHYEFNFTDGEIDDIHPHITSIVCILKDSQNNIFKREATVKNTKKGNIIKFLIGLAEGRYSLLAIEFVTDNPNDKDGVIRIGIGRTLEATDKRIQVKGAYSSVYNFGGDGTKENPYKINCDTDLYNLQAYINSDGGDKLFVGSYFEQTQDIDLWDYSYYVNFEYGWLPVGESYTKPFQGHYDGKGHKITGMFINRENQSGLGVFGVLYNAVIQNLNVDDVQISGDGAVGAVAGAVRGDGKQASVSLIKNCTVSNSKLTGNAGVGGILGLTDVLTSVQIDSCKTTADNSITTTSYGAGGIVGGGVTNSSLAVTNCRNEAPVNGGIANIGGIIGGADTLFVISCHNSGNITASATDENVRGIGGIVGGAGISNIIDAHNQGNIEGYKGVGGILGSTIISANEDGSNAVYNNAHIQSSHNSGQISGNKIIGGLCGEAQLSVFQSYNEGEVKAVEDYAGGILGATSASVLHIATNFGNVSGRKNVGGIAGKTQEGSYAINTNFGNITASEDWVGGIFGKTGNQSIIHYCGNYGKITLSGKGKIGGIAGEIGDPREWNGWDIAEVVIGSAEIAVSVACSASLIVYAAKGTLSHAMHVIHIAHSISDAVLLASNVITNAYTANLLNFPPDGDHLEQAEMRRAELEDICKKHLETMEAKFDTYMTAAPFKASTLGLSDIPMTQLKTNRTSVINFYNANSENHEFFNERIYEVMEERYEEVEENKHKEELVHTIIQGVCMVASLVTLVVGSAVTGGTATALLAAGIVVGAVSGANSISKGVRNYDANTLEISQCVNFGEISAIDGSDAGSIAGKVADFSLLSNNLNGGTYDPDKTKPFAGEEGGKVTIEHSLDIYKMKKSEGKDVTKSDIYKKETYSGWDFDEIWFLEEKEGYYPVPDKSKMTFKEE